ncbi:enoyl-CoA hydratase [Amycolatopsis sp. K13G38]|uniref:Enoyl-CoA hydratase n=1 Tax=Amycolatopsis acididurans TaxID=2724524 RepID=A0ABX1J7H3_9PSEU|nr:enoyl-CoA hydratase [Amycolatopsis acididurans]NKQ55737.1 enoyl-CoA hydratase [Amycolatopsis acididurans]
MTERILAERVGKVAVITVDAPDRRNSLTLPLSADLEQAVADAEADRDVHALIVTGTPPAFCAGADLTALGEAREEGLRAVYSGFLAVAQSTLPTIAAVGGAAVGAGMNLALAADVRIAGPRAKFIPRFLELGLHPGGGFTWMLQRAVGPQRARAMALFGQSLDAQGALEAGLTMRTVDGTHEELLSAALELARPAADAPREVVLATKRSMRLTMPLAEHLDAVDTEIVPQLESLNSAEFERRLAAMQATIKRRK